MWSFARNLDRRFEIVVVYCHSSLRKVQVDVKVSYPVVCAGGGARMVDNSDSVLGEAGCKLPVGVVSNACFTSPLEMCLRSLLRESNAG